MPMCPEPLLFTTDVIIRRAQMVIGTASQDILNSDLGVDLSGSSPNLILDNNAVKTSNVDSIGIHTSNASLMLLINVTDVSRGATVQIPAHAYTDGEGNPGAENKTLVFPPIPSVSSPTGQSARAIATVSVAATTTSAFLGGAAGSASGSGIGRSVANLQFYAWTTGLAIPYLPASYKDLVNALRWSTIIPERSHGVNVDSTSIEAGGGAATNGSGMITEDAEITDSKYAQSLVTEEDVHRTLKLVTIAFACLCAVHAGMLNYACRHSLPSSSLPGIMIYGV